MFLSNSSSLFRMIILVTQLISLMKIMRELKNHVLLTIGSPANKVNFYNITKTIIVIKRQLLYIREIVRNSIFLIVAYRFAQVFKLFKFVGFSIGVAFVNYVNKIMCQYKGCTFSPDPKFFFKMSQYMPEINVKKLEEIKKKL